MKKSTYFFTVLFYTSLLNCLDDNAISMRVPIQLARMAHITEFVNHVRGPGNAPLICGSAGLLTQDDTDNDTVAVEVDERNRRFDFFVSPYFKNHLEATDSSSLLDPLERFYILRAYHSAVYNDNSCYIPFGFYPQVSSLKDKALSLLRLIFSVGIPTASAVILERQTYPETDQSGFVDELQTIYYIPIACAAVAGISFTLSMQDLLRKMGYWGYASPKNRKFTDVTFAAANGLSTDEILWLLADSGGVDRATGDILIRQKLERND